MYKELNEETIFNNTKNKINNISTIITVVTNLLIIGSIFLSVYYYFTLKIDLSETFLFIVPLIAYAFYNIFYINEIQYSFVDKIILISSMFLYLISYMIYQFASNEIIVLIYNISTLIMFIQILKSIILHLYLRLLVYSLRNISNKINKLKIVVSQNSSLDKKQYNKYTKSITKCFVSLEYWYRISPTSLKIKNTYNVLSTLNSILNFQQKLSINYNDLEVEKIENDLLNIVEIYEDRFLKMFLKYDKNTEIILKYFVNKIKLFYNTQKFDQYSNEIYRYLFTIMERIIQAGKPLEFDKGISILASFVDYKLEKKVNQEELKQIRKTIILSINLIRKYLDNINSISGKFLLQTITKNYKVLISDGNNKIAYYLFLLIDLLKSKDDETSTIVIYYHFLSDIVKLFDDIKEKISFLKDIIRSLAIHEEEISAFVFHDLNEIYGDGNNNNDELIKSIIDIHQFFEEKVINRHSVIIIQFICGKKGFKDTDAIISMLVNLMTNNTEYGVYLFQKIYRLIDSKKYHILDFIKKKKNILIIIENEIIKKITYSNDLDVLIDNMYKLNHYILSKEYHKANEKIIQNFYEDTFDTLEEYFSYSNNPKNMIDAIEWMRSFSRIQNTNSTFRYATKKIYNIGIRSLQSMNYDVQTSVSENFGWTLFSGLSSENVRVATAIKAYEDLIDYFIRSCIFSSLYVQRYIGTAIVINYVQLRKNYSLYKDYEQINNSLKKISDSNPEVKKVLVESIQLKNGLIDDFFNDKTFTNTEKYLNELRKILGNLQ